MKRWLPFLLLGLALIGMGVVLSNYASDQAGKITDDALVETGERQDPAEAAACERAQAHYDELWDQSLENPDDMEKEEELGVALGELYEACGTIDPADSVETIDSSGDVETIEPDEIEIVK